MSKSAKVMLVNLPYNLLWGLLDANRLISPHEMNSRVFVPSAALQICDLIDVHLVDDAPGWYGIR